MNGIVAFLMQDSGQYSINTEASVKFAVADIDKRVIQELYRFGYSVRTTRPEKCDIFAQRYLSQPITTKFQKHCLYFLNLQKPCQNISISEYNANFYSVVYRKNLSIRADRTD